MNKANIKALFNIVICLVILIVVILNHKGFLLYALKYDVIRHINIFSLAYNLIFVPVAGIIFLMCFYGFGKRLLNILGGNSIDPYYTDIFSLALGMGLFNFIVYVFAFLGIIYPLPVLFLLAAGALISVRDIRYISLFKRNPFKTWNPVLLLAVFIALFYSLIQALAPPTSWDALAYHLPIPKFYAENHRIALIPSMVMKQCSIGMEMVSCAALSLGMDSLPQLISFFTEIFVLYALYLFAKRNYTESIARLSVVLFSIMPLSMALGGVTNNDYAVCLFSLLAVICFLEYVHQRKSGMLYLAAVFCGFAFTAKMSGVITVTWLLFSLIFVSVRGKSRIPGKALLTAAAILVLSASAVCIRNFAFTGNPVFPFLSDVFKGGDADVRQVIKKINFESVMTNGVKISFINYLKLPYYLVARQEKFQYQPHFFVISALLVFLFRVFFAKKRFSPVELFLLLSILYFFTIWFFEGAQLWRYALIVLPFMALLAAKWCFDQDSRVIRIASFVILSMNAEPLLAWNVNNQLFGALSLPSLENKGESPRDHYLARSLDCYNVYKYINGNLPADAGILLFREVRGYYLERPYVWGDPLNQSVIFYPKYADSFELLNRLKTLKITHVVVNNNGYSPSPYYYDERTMELMGKLLAQYSRRIYENNGVELYQLDYK